MKADLDKIPYRLPARVSPEQKVSDMDLLEKLSQINMNEINRDHSVTSKTSYDSYMAEVRSKASNISEIRLPDVEKSMRMRFERNGTSGVRKRSNIRAVPSRRHFDAANHVT